MIVPLLIFAAAAPPANPSLQGIVSADDYPAWAADEGQQGTTGFELLIGTDGKVQRCTVLVSSGFPRLDSYTCDLIKRRAVFEKAVDDHGNPAYGIYRSAMSWSLGGPARQLELSPDLELQINQAPAGVSLPLEFRVAYMTSATGAMSGCKVAYAAKPAPKELVDLACQTFGQGPPEIVHDLTGKPVAAWIVSSVRFTQDPVSRSTALSPASP